MNRNLALVFSLAILATMAVPAFGAQYVAKKGDTLADIAWKTKHTKEQLTLMNELKNPVIYKGQVLTYLSKQDRLHAAAWAKKRRAQLSPSSQEYEYFGFVLEDLKKNRITYAINDYHGTHFSVILYYAETQGKMCRLGWKSKFTQYQDHGNWTSEAEANKMLETKKVNTDFIYWIDSKY